MNLPEKLKAMRTKQGLTQDQIVERLGIKRSAYASYEEGRAIPLVATLKKIAEFHGCSIDYLVDHDAEPPDESKIFMARFTEAPASVQKCVMKLLEM